MNAHERRVAQRKALRESGLTITKNKASIEGRVFGWMGNSGRFHGNIEFPGAASEIFPGVEIKYLENFEKEALGHLKPEKGTKVRITIEIIESSNGR